LFTVIVDGISGRHHLEIKSKPKVLKLALNIFHSQCIYLTVYSQ